MTKTIWTLNVDNYAPEITALTYPLIERYAKKIGASFRIIDTRKWPDRAPVYEKLQMFELGRSSDWNIYLDGDALVHPDCIDITAFLPFNTVCHNGADLASNRWRYDEYFLRDGRHIGSCNWFAVASAWCLDLWHPLDDYDGALEQIHPTIEEQNAGLTREHLIDDYTLSRNIARYGLKFKSLFSIYKDLADPGGPYLWHQYLLSNEKKVEAITTMLKGWQVR